ncbi:M3 family metallopeptidase [Deinococcus radiodurans]|jgi:oligopeptidase A (EC:3.4.24.70). Metallo peptidase. MEROPS family M03A|uniref:oligopeptidase A n=1 Tax=Deinococcus radiodurans (strain ATCC 13939 / DSM 20539 / JCM 16871 / CCUG 27074 / LMG 4051 / NBRC 15346 / NCIMB 9279 / VKM B-1422 / R1) TaxID=243230 RepID=Q9RTU7_DEIRA|nr:M3 family metallopeptidase [Deinococcus radiodurans]AAF11213.1 oligopeptidase A [Deinococcus radiodurans R1 = ATCC 13939 = DSM 20539]ANC71236.1 oligopeptidase A [Deinococcus radiodurans R1 = ATCC 13939 = DSM 20539]QEM71086.1 M3 family peptidase [Deinococcus radiodurans]QIP29637.1 M3 family metallopeptidase [Deinococcus radiodurans]QIP31678.1 M3 family metallopeptidase [Deinococcus radiodurans]
MTQSTAQSSNPLLNIGFKIPFDQIRPEHAEPAVDELLAAARERVENLARSGERNFENFMADLDTLTEQLGTVNTIVHHLDSVVSSDEWKAATEAIIPKTTQFYTELSLHPGLWGALKAFGETDTAKGLDPVRARHLKLTTDEFRRGGADLPDDQKARLLEVNTKLAQTTNQFAKNVLDATAAYELYVPTERLGGVPQRVQDATRQDAQSKGQEDHRLTLHAPTLQPILTYADDRELRRELWEASGMLGQQEGRDNRPLIREILKLRREQAEILGFANFADYVLEDRMAKSGQGALNFERDLDAKTRPAYERENAELEAYYREKAGADAPALAPWDIAYWAEKQRQEKYDFDEEALRPYFALDNVLSGLFEICRRVFGITVKEAQAPGWHPEVKFYDIFDEAGTHIASFYTDWFPRDTKRGGAWMNAFITGGPKEGGVDPHLGLMCGNMTPPSSGGQGADAPALLSIREVETVFHEFGHLLHHAMSRVPVKSLSGTNVAWDFVELPSQIMENWVMEREALDLFARHYQTGEKLPDDLFQKLVKAQNYRAANFAMRQYSFGLTDLTLHVEYDPSGEEDPVAVARDVMARFYPTELPGNYAQVASFNHLFSSPVGYGAGYYSYKWAEVLDADAFSRFAKEGIFNRETGRAYVDSILSRGGSADPAALYREFMGRDPDADALLRRSGLL